ncbi:fatty acid desaturase [Prosthecobacter sp.]|uniref:fatty acid desaturase n=1 Tax=Prosthecobacter sp. TaxID=1965333 RepID=UPI003784A118
MQSIESIDGAADVVRQDEPHPTTTSRVVLPRNTIPDLPPFIGWLNPIWQGFFTLLHGIARPGDQPLFKPTNVTEVVRYLACYSLGILLMSGIAIHWEYLMTTVQVLPPALQLLAWIFWIYVTVIAEFVLLCGGVRVMQTTIVHEATHGKLCKDKETGRLIAEWITILLGTQPFHLYKPEHLNHHDGSAFATLLDADARMFVDLLGFTPGQPLDFYWRQLFKAILIPKVAIYWNLARLRQNLFEMPPAGLRWRLAAAWSLLLLRGAAVIGSSMMVGNLLPVALYGLLWALPVWLLYPLSMTLQACSEHTWLARRKPGEGAKLFLHRRLLNRFPFTPWTGIENVVPFLLKVFTRDLFIRGFILCGSLPLHGRHHTTPAESVELWPLERYRAADEYAKGEVTVPTYTSLLAAMESVFLALSALPPLNTGHKPVDHPGLQVLAIGM